MIKFSLFLPSIREAATGRQAKLGKRYSKFQEKTLVE